MDEESTQHKILLLIDVDSIVSKTTTKNTSSETETSQTPPSSCLNNIRAAALRILYRFLSKSSRGKPLQWAYKIFSQKKAFKEAKTKYKLKSSFQDLNVSNFEAFERIIINSFNVVHAYNKGHNLETENDDYPSGVLQKQLKEVIVDYQWSDPVLFSPVKSTSRRRSGKKVLETSNASQSNHLYLFSFCPRFKQEFLSFNGDSQVGLDTLLTSFMSVELQRIFRKTCMFHWLDLTTGVTVVNEKGEHLSSLMQDALKVISGSVISIESVLNSGFLSLTYLGNSAVNNDSDSNVTSTLPISSSTSLTHIDDFQSYSSRLFTGNINSEQNCISVKTSPIFANMCAKKQSRERRDSSIHIDTKTAVTVFTKDKNEDPTRIDIDITYEKLPSKELMTSLQICVVGSLALHDMPEICYTSNYVYMISPDSAKDAKHFEAFFMSCVKYNLYCVCDVYLGEACLTGVLKPLTSTTATLSLLPSVTSCLPLHKQLLASKTSFATNQEERLTNLDDFIQKSVQHIVDVRQLANEDKKWSTKATRSCRSELVEPFNPGLLEDFYVPGCIKQSTCAGSHRLHSEKNESFLDEELQLVKLLQEKYIQKKSKRLTDRPLRKSPRKSLKTSEIAGKRLCGSSPDLRRSLRKKLSHSFSSTKVANKNVALIKPKVLKHNRSHTAPTRGDKILENSSLSARLEKTVMKETVMQQGSLKKKGHLLNNASKKVSVKDDLKTEGDVVSYLTKTYDETLLNADGLLTVVQRLINLTSLFMQAKSNVNNPQDSTYEMISKTLLHTAKNIKQKHKDFTNITFREYELQVLLHMELETLLREPRTEDELDDKANDISLLLVPLGIAKHGFVANYLNKTLLTNYLDSLPVLLARIYDELMVPIPSELLKRQPGGGLFSPSLDSVDMSSVRTRSVKSCGSVTSNNSAGVNQQSSSRRKSDKVLNRYSSFHSVTNRQIELPKQLVSKSVKTQKSMGDIGKRRSAVHIASATKTKNKPDKGGSGDSAKVKKNLFGGIREGGTRGARGDRERKIPEHVMKSFKSKKKAKSVAETPAHKQKSNLTWRRQEQARRKSGTPPSESTVQIIPESPSVKDESNTPRKTPKKTPKKTARGVILKRKSFYSSKSDFTKNDITERIEKLESRLTNKILSPTYSAGKSKLLSKFPHSPRRVQARTLFINLHSPSPKKPVTKLSTYEYKSMYVDNKPHRELKRKLTPQKRAKIDPVTPKRKRLKTIEQRRSVPSLGGYLEDMGEEIFL